MRCANITKSTNPLANEEIILLVQCILQPLKEILQPQQEKELPKEELKQVIKEQKYPEIDEEHLEND